MREIGLHSVSLQTLYRRYRSIIMAAMTESHSSVFRTRTHKKEREKEEPEEKEERRKERKKDDNKKKERSKKERKRKNNEKYMLDRNEGII